MKKLLANTDHRDRSLVIAAILGLISALVIYYFSRELCNKTLQNSITILALGFFIFYVLWVFRTHDVQKQIDKTEENTNNSTFFECARMLAEEKPAEKESAEEKPESSKDENFMKREFSLTKTALEQLAYIRKTGFDKDRIDSLTTGGLDLRGKNFNFARFSGLDLSMANLNQTILFNANLTDAILLDANLTRAHLRCAGLANANLSRADLRGANLTDARLSNANLIKAYLSGVKLANANLSGADLRGAKLNRTKVDRAELDGAGLRGAKSDRVELKGADLTGTDLTGAKLTGAKLDGVIYDDETKFSGTVLESKEMRGEAGMKDISDEPAEKIPS